MLVVRFSEFLYIKWSIMAQNDVFIVFYYTPILGKLYQVVMYYAFLRHPPDDGLKLVGMF